MPSEEFVCRDLMAFYSTKSLAFDTSYFIQQFRIHLEEMKTKKFSDFPSYNSGFTLKVFKPLHSACFDKV